MFSFLNMGGGTAGAADDADAGDPYSYHDARYHQPGAWDDHGDFGTEESASETDPDSFSDESEVTDDQDDEVVEWIPWFHSLAGNEILAAVTIDFIEDEFNLTGLSALVPYYQEALDVILDNETDENVDMDLVDSSAQLLYSLIHARYVTTKAGLHQMYMKLENRDFGVCPRVLCNGYPLLPVGEYDQPGMGSVHFYCHNCEDIYEPFSKRYSRLDGATFGSTFPHLLFQSYPGLHEELQVLLGLAPTPARYATSSPVPPADPDMDVTPLTYVPKMFGFRVSEAAYVRPHAYWLRWQPGCDPRSGLMVPPAPPTMADETDELEEDLEGEDALNEAMDVDAGSAAAAAAAGVAVRGHEGEEEEEQEI
ncbi:hypothetical protein AMAG_09065 [Allomyces macrogynus ATCC 38327]|uniref:Casein kinase II subunit beta n=1 Tax=Allomyces macrogynus (strain ATCC 38327) TaxID=578462 RepID=A0A0L0SNP8_ALLM3|nr:hypothetical protein AMAG_09065 [Allomyces macrogynus ATCC 38327]|eukprot:KNE64005.1 hypothetical protein AMAG_09065 [Allomyces macrogynus ATCC 38327]